MDYPPGVGRRAEAAQCQAATRHNPDGETLGCIQRCNDRLIDGVQRVTFQARGSAQREARTDGLGPVGQARGVSEPVK
ncbi:hypothetical protein D3C87_1669820 [compost metagenome]